MSTATSVHWTQPGLMALPEKDGHGDSCGPIVILDYRHVAQGVPLDIATLDAERAELIRWGLMNVKQADGTNEVGMTMAQIDAALRLHYGVQPLKFVDWNPSLDFNTFHQDIINALLAHQLVIVEGHNAQAWPNNQAGVQNHFILLGGIDSKLGYYVCNGDTYAALSSVTPSTPVWYSIGQLQAGGVASYLILPSVDAAPHQGSTTMLPAGWSDDGTTLRDPEGHGITQGYRDAVLAWPGGWPADNYALTGSDDSLASVEYANPAIGKGTRRVFRYTALGWSPTFNGGQVYRIWMGAELLAREAQVATLENQPPPPPPAKPQYGSELAAVQDALDALETALKNNGEA